MLSNTQSPKLSWDMGTAYDLFMSLDVLHKPENFGLRGAWAAGVRSRLPAEAREILQQTSQVFFHGPLYWVYDSLPQPKDSLTVLETLEKIPASERFQALGFHPNMPPQAREVLEKIMTQQRWTEQDLKAARSFYEIYKFSRKDVPRMLDTWAQALDLGERYLAALRVYYEVFFAEEEMRIRPALRSAVEQSQKLAQEVDVATLVEKLSEGFHFAETLQMSSELVLAPSFWITPLVAYVQIASDRMLFVFGGRPAEASLVPGEVVPDMLSRGLKALADPTRLRILRYLTLAPMTPAKLSRKLRLRAPTMVHHLRTLRLAGLVHLTLESGKKVHYTARPEAVASIHKALQSFLEKDISEEET